MKQQKGQRVLVIGGAGYLGTVLTGQLLDDGHRVQVLDSLRFGDQHLAALQKREGFSLVRGDMRDIAAMSACVKDAEAVILLGSLVGEPACDLNPKETVDINLIATKAVAEACRYYEVPRFIFASTDSVYGIQEGKMYEHSSKNPISLYGRLKVKAEEEIMGLSGGSFQPTIMRMATIYGLSPRMRFDLVVNALTLNAVCSGKITVYGGAQWRPFVHVADAAQAYVRCLSAPLGDVGGQAFNVGSNEQNYQIGQLAEIIRQVFPRVEVQVVPQSPDLRDYYVCCDKITNVLGYRADRGVAEGVREIKAALENGTIANPADSRYYNVPRK
jgi:nucleoside-diphosphate-sugar epimerase